jgi:tetratricopeptide (TPR) repeat protein
MKAKPRASGVTVVATIAAILALVPAASHQRLEAADAGLAEVKVLYANASYEEAIQQLNAIHSEEDAVQVDQYLALCLLALGRPDEAERSLEHIVARQPLYVLNEDDASPKFVDLFRQVRSRALPAAALAAYTQGRASFDAKQFADAAAQFKQVIAIADDRDVGASLVDLKRLGEGFLALSEATLTQAGVTAPAPAAATVAPESDQRDRTYSAADDGVVPPGDISTQLPRWVPPDRASAQRTIRGAIAVLIDEHGTVESVSVAEPLTPFYDHELLTSARQWKFRPATKDGKPVRYRKMIEVVLRPATE